MLFSVIMCVNKDNAFIDKAILSILNQTYESFEFIIVANNCTDELYDKLKNFDYDKRLRLYRTDIGQLSFNLNYAINLSKGDFIIRMDADDISYSNRLSDCAKYTKYDLVAFSANYINENDDILKVADISKNNMNYLIYKNPIIHPAVMIKKAIIIRNRGYLGGFQSEDYDFWLRLSRDKTIKTLFTNEIVLGYRINDNQSRGSNLPYCEVAGYMIRDFYFTFRFRYFVGFLVASIKFILNKLRIL